MPKQKPITVADLIEALNTLPQKAVIVLAKDIEGNGFHHVLNLTVESDESEVCIWPEHEYL